MLSTSNVFNVVHFLVHGSANQQNQLFGLKRKGLDNSLSWDPKCRTSTWWVHVGKFNLIQLYVPSTRRWMSPLNWKLRLWHDSHFGLFIHLNQEAKGAVTVLVGVTDPDYLGEIGLLLHDGEKKESMSNTEDPFGDLLVSPWPVMKTNGKLQQPHPGRLLMAQTLQEWKWGLTPTPRWRTTVSWGACWRQRDYEMGSGWR